ncbi:hypothetical protein ISCGN_018787 [Ixodes scapularis]
MDVRKTAVFLGSGGSTGCTPHLTVLRTTQIFNGPAPRVSLLTSLLGHPSSRLFGTTIKFKILCILIGYTPTTSPQASKKRTSGRRLCFLAAAATQVGFSLFWCVPCTLPMLLLLPYGIILC